MKQESGRPNLITGEVTSSRSTIFLMHTVYSLPPRYGRFVRAAVLGVVACTAVASDSTLPASDPRSARLEAFFKAYDCPAPLHVDEYLRAADSHDLDYRLLPAISLVESTCGAFEKLNNRWGWDSVQTGFPSVPDGIEFITAQLAENPHYKGKTVEQKLFTYNPYRQYVREVKRLMQEIED